MELPFSPPPMQQKGEGRFPREEKGGFLTFFKKKPFNFSINTSKMGNRQKCHFFFGRAAKSCLRKGSGGPKSTWDGRERNPFSMSLSPVDSDEKSGERQKSSVSSVLSSSPLCNFCHYPGSLHLPSSSSSLLRSSSVRQTNKESTKQKVRDACRRWWENEIEGGSRDGVLRAVVNCLF